MPNPSSRTTVFDAIELLPYVPVLGSHRLPASIEGFYGEDARKIVVKPCDVICRILPEGDYLVLGIAHTRAAR